MTVLVFTLLVAVGSVAAGFLGALTGLGGGVVIVPMLTLLFHVNIYYAAGASLVSVIATSSGSAAAYVREGYSNVRVGMFLEVATTVGAVTGAFVAFYLHTDVLFVVFGVFLLLSAWLSNRPHPDRPGDGPDALATRLRLDSTYPTAEGPKAYHVRGVPLGFGLMYVAGTISGLLGIGSGALKVLAMDRAMRLPFKVSTTTSNFMIGVTATASAGVYLSRGQLDPGLAMPVMLGVLFGSMIGARVLTRAKSSALRMLFTAVIVVLALQMIYKGFGGKGF
jgi:uncharacterized membrane protein YfcA